MRAPARWEGPRRAAVDRDEPGCDVVMGPSQEEPADDDRPVIGRPVHVDRCCLRRPLRNGESRSRDRPVDPGDDDSDAAPVGVVGRHPGPLGVNSRLDPGCVGHDATARRRKRLGGRPRQRRRTSGPGLHARKRPSGDHTGSWSRTSAAPSATRIGRAVAVCDVDVTIDREARRPVVAAGRIGTGPRDGALSGGRAATARPTRTPAAGP